MGISKVGAIVLVVLATLGDCATAAPPSEELQRYDIKDLRIVGIALGTTNPLRQNFATILDKYGYFHYAVLGQKIGKDHGVLTRFRANSITISEVYEDSVMRDRVLPLENLSTRLP